MNEPGPNYLDPDGLPHLPTERECPVCKKKVDYLERFYDRHNIYSGRACSDACARSLPGQGAMWNYDAEEPLEDPDGGWDEL